MPATVRETITGLFTSISEIFFVRRWEAGAVIWFCLLVLHPVPGMVGTFALLSSLFFDLLFRVNIAHPAKQILRLNAFLVGLGYEHFYGFSFAGWEFLALATVLFIHQAVHYVILGLLHRSFQLPVLTLSFVLTIQILITFFPFQATQGSPVLWSVFGTTVQSQLVSLLPEGVSTFFRSLGVLLFVRDETMGLVIAGIILVYSRVLFSLALVAGIPLILSGLGTSSNGEIIIFNCMVTVMMISAVLDVPSRWSYRNGVVFGLLCFLVGSLLGMRASPALNLPFIITIFAYVVSKPYLNKVGALPFDFTAGTPEQNLYYAQNRNDRYTGITVPSFALPFHGTWKVTQAHRGEYTHKNDWQHAWDFEIIDGEGRFSKNGSTSLVDFYSYRQPVCAALDGEVANIQSFVQDNAPGAFNFGQNWGNTVVIRHPDGTFSAYSHLSYLPETIFIGKWVYKGEVIGYCGNSGRSERPHLHFQFQSTARIGEKTLPSPIKKFLVPSDGRSMLKMCDYPKDGELVSNPSYSVRMAEAFNFPFGRELTASGIVNGEARTEHWISTVDFSNHTFLYCNETKAVAYFFVDDGVFFFTDYFGPRNSLLSIFAMSASKIVYSEQPGLAYDDQLPLNRVAPSLANFLVDVVSPLVKIKELTAHYDFELAPDRTITISTTIFTTMKMLQARHHAVAHMQLSLPYGTQSIRINGNVNNSTHSFTIS